VTYFFHILNYLSVFILTIVKFIDSDCINKYKDNLILSTLLCFFYKFKFEVAIFCSLFIMFYTTIFVFLRPLQGKRKLVKEILRRINIEIFNQNLDSHRVTLFREINYIPALVRNSFAFLYHLIFYWRKSGLYFRFLPLGHYLRVYERCGLQLLSSSTMLRVENDNEERCEGVAGLIRYKKMGIQIDDLPDILSIPEEEFLKARRLRDIRKKYRKAIANYMNKGRIRDLNLFKRIHRKARHFYGTIITKSNGETWGVLLVDSTSPSSPFDTHTKEEINSFAKTISDIINMEV